MDNCHLSRELSRRFAKGPRKVTKGHRRTYTSLCSAPRRHFDLKASPHYLLFRASLTPFSRPLSAFALKGSLFNRRVLNDNRPVRRSCHAPGFKLRMHLACCERLVSSYVIHCCPTHWQVLRARAWTGMHELHSHGQLRAIRSSRWIYNSCGMRCSCKGA